MGPRSKLVFICLLFLMTTTQLINCKPASRQPKYHRIHYYDDDFDRQFAELEGKIIEIIINDSSNYCR